MSDETSKVAIVVSQRIDSCKMLENVLCIVLYVVVTQQKCAFQKGNWLTHRARYRGTLMGPHNMAAAEP